MLKQSQEDYLRTIHQIYKDDKNNISSVNVANYLNVSKAAVSKMLKKLVVKKLIKMKPYSNIEFTKEGLQEAKNLTYKHKIIKNFLIDMLKINKNKIYEEAHNLEHSFSDQTIKKLASFLKNPKLYSGDK